MLGVTLLGSLSGRHWAAGDGRWMSSGGWTCAGSGHCTRPAVYCLAAAASTGRVADRAIMDALGWQPDTRLHVRVTGGLIVVDADEHGVFVMSGQGHVRPPGRVRYWCRVAIGDRVLLVADPAHRRLVVHPPAALDAMIALAHADVVDRRVE
jgi:hypothetical protein